MFCTRCGADCSDGSKFCGICGSPLNVQPIATQNNEPLIKHIYYNTYGLTFLNDGFVFTDEDGLIIYKAKMFSENIIDYGCKLCSVDDTVLFLIKPQTSALSVMNFIVLDANENVISKALQQNKIYHFDKYDITTEGDYLSHNFRFTCDGKTLASVRKKLMPWGDCYELEFADRKLESMLLCAVLVTETVWYSNRIRR